MIIINSEYYDGTKLLSLNDINGNKPEVYICTTNRTGGKTTYFSRLLVNRFLDKNEKFALLYRFNYELDECADKFFKDIKGLFFNNHDMKSRKRAKGVYHDLFLDDVHCGYAISLNNADQIKKYSHLFSDVSRIMFDEFQSETNHYCNNEVKKFISIHTSIARGQGEQVRYVPCYLIGNPVTLLNPYYVTLNISSRLSNGAKFLKGDGFVVEQGYVESASNNQALSPFNRAFSNDSYVAYSSQSVYLNDNTSFISEMKGSNRYLVTLRCDGCDYAIREYAEQGIVYCSENVDSTYPIRISITTDDHQINYVMLNQHLMFINALRNYFERGCFRFKNLKCKQALLKAISY